MSTEQMGTYEKIYFALWELGQRYGNFVQFRVIGRSHDDRMIPMLEIGKGDTCIICLSGVESGDRNLPEYLLSIAKDYCRSYESNWTIGESYEVRKLLDKVRICMIPMLNPDSYEICEYGYGAIHNPIHRQMLKMQDRPVEEYECNARGIDLRRNFPTNYYQRKRVNQEPASENETRALISIFRNIQALACLHSVIPEGRSFTADRRKALPTIRKITDWQGIYRNVPAIVWKKGLQVVRESKKPEQNLRWDLRNSFMRK